MLKRTVLSAFCAGMVATGVAMAQSSATLTLRSGEKVSGDLIDLAGVGYTVRVAGNERQIPQNDVAVIDFTGGTMSDADWAKFTGGTQIVLKNGQTIDGQLIDIGGANPLRLSIRTSSGERDLTSNEVARIVIARPNSVAAPTGTTGVAATPGVAGAVTVQANQPWTSTGRTVRRGQSLTFTSTGEIQLSDDPNDLADANGAKNARYATNAPMKQVLAGALIGRIGNGAPFAVGNQTISMPASGVLFLGVNDDGFADNKGNFQVVIK